MKVSPLPTEFFAQSTIDKDNITVLPHESCGWLLSSPLTTIFSRMHLSCPLRSQQYEANGAMAKQNVESRTVACQVSSDDFPDHCSLSSYSSEESDSWVMEDIFESPQCNLSYNNNNSSYGSPISQLDDEEQIWCLWDTNKDMVSPEPLLYPVTSDPIQVREQGQLGTTRKLPSQIQFDSPESRKSHHLKRASAVRSPRCITRTRVAPTSPVFKTPYSAFPPGIPTIPKLHQDYHKQCHSFPASNELRVRPQRSRANTTPAPTATSLHKASHTSNLNTCAALAQNSQSSPRKISVPQFMYSAPASPQCPPLPERDFMDLMAETSAFSDDDDEDDDDDAPTFVLAMKSVLTLGRRTSNAEDEKLPVDKARRKVPRMTLSSTLNSWFKRKKGAAL